MYLIRNLLLLLFLFTVTVWSQSLKAEYRVSFGIFGQVGLAKADLQIEGKRYTIRIEGYAIGMAKRMSKGRKEVHISSGHIVEGRLVSDRYEVNKEYGKKKTIKLYSINHTKREVKKSKKKYRDGKLVFDKNSILDFYAQDDLLTLYFNISKLIDKKEEKSKHLFSAVGAERQKGSVEILIPSIEERKVYESSLGRGDYWYLTAIIYQKIFASNQGELYLAIDKDGITQKAMLKDVLLFGDVLVERIK